MEKQALCIDCKHHIEVEEPKKNCGRDQCSHPQLIDPVRGDFVNCADMRARARFCGRDGALFLQRL